MHFGSTKNQNGVTKVKNRKAEARENSAKPQQ